LFFFLFFCVFAGFLMASTEESFDYKVKGVKFASSFYYDPQPNLPYPTCSVQKGFTFPGVTSASLADFAFLATMSFAGPDEAQPLLNQWFSDGQVVDDYEYVAQYRKATGTASHPVSYKLFTISALPESAIVAIRGSESMWDWMVDIQLWCGGVLAQIIKAVNPFGWLWEPILDDVVYFINSVQSEELKEVSYYRYTSAFVMDLYAGFGGRKFTSLWTTGASLGGGLSILTGAITGASAVAISGLNAMYSRHTFDPPITAEQLNTRVFNTIPERDIIAHIDEPGMLVQHMQCRGAKVKKPFLGLDVVIVHTIVLMHQLSLFLLHRILHLAVILCFVHCVNCSISVEQMDGQVRVPSAILDQLDIMGGSLQRCKITKTAGVRCCLRNCSTTRKSRREQRRPQEKKMFVAFVHERNVMNVSAAVI
jgi:hypothetical protein